MRLFIKVFILFLLSSKGFSGFKDFTMHSRANCLNNESISWEWNVYRTLGTVSQHFQNGTFIHQVSSGWDYTWRSAAVHWTEGSFTFLWQVIGYHWIRINGSDRLLKVTNVTDCSGYNGWWDK